jgi:hypothetical protein
MSSLNVEDVMLRQTWLLYHLPPTSQAKRKQLTEKDASRALQSLGENTTYVSWKSASKEETIKDLSIWYLKSFSRDDETLAAEVVAFLDDRLCFVRGKANWYKVAVRWIGCDDHRYQWSQTEMTVMVAQLLRNSSQEKDSQATSLVFQVPTHLADCGLDTVSLSIPPANMNQFCNSIEESRPLREDGFPIIRALQRFVRQNFNLNLQSFLFTKFTTPQASIDHDGRIQPYKDLSILLDVIAGKMADRHKGAEASRVLGVMRLQI